MLKMHLRIEKAFWAEMRRICTNTPKDKDKQIATVEAKAKLVKSSPIKKNSNHEI